MVFMLVQTSTLSDLQNKPDTCANSIDPDESAHNQPSYQDLHVLPFSLILIAALFAKMDLSKFNY